MKRREFLGVSVGLTAAASVLRAPDALGRPCPPPTVSVSGGGEVTTSCAATGASPPLPEWVPPPGEVALLTQSNGRLANHFRSQCAPYFSAFHFVKTVNDYSGSFKNPYWGTWGCTVFWGGGHAGTNDNTVTVAEYGTSAITFKRACDPTPWFGSGTDSSTRELNSTADANAFLNFTYMESTIDGKPGAPHSYGSGDIVGPEYGGAANGSLLQVISAAVNYRNDAGAVAAHELRFETTTTASSARSWRRLTNNTGSTNGPFGPGAAPNLTAFVGPQQRVYIVSNGANVPSLVRWFDRNANLWVRGSGVGFSYDEADGFDSGILFYVPQRDLLVCMYPLGGRLKVQWMNVSVAQPTLGSAVTLSMTLNLTLPWSAATWCPHNNRIILIGVTGDDTAAYEIEIPAVLSSAWTVTRAPFGAGQTLAPADPTRGIGLTWKKFHYDEKVRSVVYMPLAMRDGDDQVWVYRPRST